MNGKRARSIRRFFGENKTAARRARHDIARDLTAAAQQPKNLGAGPAVPVGRAGNGKPDAMAPHASPMPAGWCCALRRRWPLLNAKPRR